jgi:choline-sulfatase
VKRVAVAALALLIIAGCHRGSAARPSRTTSVFLISVDTLRSDHLPAYGYRGVETPRLDALRAESVLFEHAYSHCPLTLPSHLTMLTGLLPADHGVRDNIGFKLAGSIPTLGSLLQGNGYATGAAVSAFVLRRDSGISRGFDFYDDEVEPVGPSLVIGRVQRDGRETVRVAENWIDQQTKPVFFFLHLYEPHTPYTPPEPYFSRYPNHYDGEIAYADDIVGSFLDYLKRKNLYDDALILFVSDHGEGLNEHGEEEHGIFLYREALQVPLLVKLPRGARRGQSVAEPVELIDVFRTILEQTDTKLPTQRNDARSLLASNATVRAVYSETFYPRFHFGWSDLHSLIDGQHHYIRAPIPELYDLVSDPAEKKNVVDEQRRAYTAMRQAIEPLVRQATAPVNVDPEEARKLAALGYIGSTVETGANEQLPDPKTTIGTFHDIRLAFTKYRNEKQEEALEITNRLLKENPRILDLWDLKSNILMKLGRNEEAIAAAKEGLRQSPNAVQLMFGVANLSILTGELDQAQQHAELAMKWEPGQAHEVLARVWADRRDFTRAEQEAKLAMETEHEPIGALMTLGLIEKQKGDLPKSLSYFEQAQQMAAEKHHRRIPNLHYYRGDILARLGRNDEAEREFRDEIALYPAQADAYTALVLLLSSEQRLDEATKLIFRLIEVAPNPPSYVAVSETLKAIGDDRGSLYWAYQGLQKFPRNPALRKLARS